MPRLLPMGMGVRCLFDGQWRLIAQAPQAPLKSAGNSDSGLAEEIQGMSECMASRVETAMHSLFGLFIGSQGEEHSSRPLPVWDGFIPEYR